VKPGDVVVVRYEGPRGGPGMQEMLRREALESDGGYAPKLRDRFVSPTLRAYAAMATSADTGAVRDNNAVERAVAAAAQSRAPVS
jgi:dihydroxyacid dehydratase/phosphogluconate dehydratase